MILLAMEPVPNIPLIWVTQRADFDHVECLLEYPNGMLTAARAEREAVTASAAIYNNVRDPEGLLA